MNHRPNLTSTLIGTEKLLNYLQLEKDISEDVISNYEQMMKTIYGDGFWD